MRERKNAELEMKVIAAYQKRIKLVDISKEFGVTRNDIYNILSHNNIPTNRYKKARVDKKRKISDEAEKDIIDMYGKQIRTREIAEKYNVSDNTILRILRKNGITTSCGYRIYRS